jgi:hypothetical protein
MFKALYYLISFKTTFRKRFSSHVDGGAPVATPEADPGAGPGMTAVRTVRCGADWKVARIGMVTPTSPLPTPTHCAACGAADVRTLVYGYPAPELVHRAERGEVVLGGCVIERGSPRWACRVCKREWGRIGESQQR